MFVVGGFIVFEGVCEMLLSTSVFEVSLLHVANPPDQSRGRLD